MPRKGCCLTGCPCTVKDWLRRLQLRFQCGLDLLMFAATVGGGANALPTNAVGHPASASLSVYPEPSFDMTTPRNVSCTIGKSAYLSCRVRNLGNKTVSWVRHRDIHILTVGSYTYTSDQRFHTTHHFENDDWTLQIKWAQNRDAGVYECQISTQPVTSYFVTLDIIGSETEIPPGSTQTGTTPISREMQGDRVPSARILGEPDLYISRGSTINLTCVVHFSSEPSGYVFWYHQDEVINYDSPRGGITIITEKGDITISTLLVQRADYKDGGKYSCSPSNADISNVIVHILKGERPAAMQKGSSHSTKGYALTLAITFLMFIYSNYLFMGFLQAQFPQ
ncbi:hypothetical protein Trydic_g13338 [Trypoxylus dichotomus]